MDSLTSTFNERLQEIETYLDFLDALERQIRDGAPRIGGETVTAQQQKILYSSVYLQLYNLVEATVTWCLDAVSGAAAEGGRWLPMDLSDGLRREWVRHMARTHVDLNYQHRLDCAVGLCDQLIEALPLLDWSIERGGGGNWDDSEIEGIALRVGFQLVVSNDAYRGIKRKIRDDKGSLVLVKDLRNRLAHGSLSFAECGDGVTVGELKDLKDRTARYLQEVIRAFEVFIQGYEFLIPAKRPTVLAAL